MSINIHNRQSSVPMEVAGETVSPEQRVYLEGFFSGLSNRGLSFAQAEPEAGPVPLATPKKLTAEEKIKQELHPFDAFPLLRRRAKTNEAPEKEDIFRFKWNGLFWLGPVHDGYMCRLRIPGGVVRAEQLRELAAIADDLAWGYLQITTRNNVQLRVIQPRDTPELLRRVQDCGLHSRGAGADNLRNITASPTAGLDPYEWLDVLPQVRDLAHYIINHHEFYDLPRKFNVSFDGGGLVGAAEDTNDIGMRAVRLLNPPKGHPLEGKIEGGDWFQILLGGVTGHRSFASACGALCRPEDATEVIAALIRVYREQGDRSNRGKSRLIYLIERLGPAKYLEEAEKLLGWTLPRVSLEDAQVRDLVERRDKPSVPHPHIGVHPQKQEGLNWVGVYVPVGLLQSEEARAVARIAEEFGSGEVRLTIFQNLLIPNVPDQCVEAVKEALARAGLSCEAGPIRGGTAACTGNRYCKYASADTKGHALEVVDYLEKRLTLDEPLNIHVTGCPHSCAQHYIGDIGLLACKVKPEEGGDAVEGYHIFVGGGFGADRQQLGRQLFKSVPAGRCLNERLHALLQAYLEVRTPGESFLEFTRRHDVEALAAMTLGWLEKAEEEEAMA